MPNPAPMLHLNGSGRANLLPPLEEQVKALRELDRLLAANGPHMRDFYILKGGGRAEFDAAEAAHLSRRLRLEAIKEELEAMWQAIDSQS